MPIFLTDYNSEWHKSKLESSILAESNVGANSSTFQMEMAKMIRDSDNIEAVTKAFDESGSESDDSSLVGSWDLLGLRGMKVKNENEVIANI